MKLIPFYISLVLSILLFSCANTEKAEDSTVRTVDHEKERQAILAVIEGESAAFWNKDYDKWSSYWVQEPYIRTMGWWKDGGVTVVEGWNQRAERSKGN